MPPRVFRSALLGVLLLAGLGGAQAQQVIRLTASAGHPAVFPWVRMIDEFYLPEVDKRLAARGGVHRIEWTRAFGGSLIKLGNESRGLADGVADIGFVSTVLEASRFPLHNVSYVVPFGSDSPRAVSDTIEDLQQRVPAMAQEWKDNGLVHLGGASLDSYHLWTNFPVRSVNDLKGRKISAPGTSANWLRNTGAVPVAGSLGTYHEDIKSGLSSGAVTFATGAWNARLHEVARYVTKVNFGAMYAGSVAANQRRFNSLPPEVQAVLREVGRDYTRRLADLQGRQASQLLGQMQASGARVEELAPQERKNWAAALPNVAATWTQTLQERNMPGQQVLKFYTDGLRRSGAELPRDWSTN